MNTPFGLILPRYRWRENISSAAPCSQTPDGLGKLVQWRCQNGTPETGGGVTMALTDAAQPLFGPFHPMPRSPAKSCHH